ncbi:MAG TPA: M48 family metallopeptidase [Opitutaceae bacterium]|nr:M48 family metallopeptidase [Opitutaceae bacterium]
MVPTIVALLLALRLAGELVLSALNRAEVRRHVAEPPAAVGAIMDPPTYARSAAYTLERSRFGALMEVFDTLVLALVLFGGFLPWLFAHVGAWGAPGAMWDDALFIFIAGLVLSIPSLPFDWWSQFRLEEKFGFNKSTVGLWLADKLKGFALAAIIGYPLLWALLSLVNWVGPAWWIWGFALVFGFQLLMMVLYPKLILPLFNKLTPLPEGELRERLLALADRTGFRARTIEVIDGSKRSGHSNAYFTGFGRFRRIVLFDTLVAQLTPEELAAVLAHEIGHYRRGHIPKMIALSAATLLGAFAVIAWLARSAWFDTAFGFPAGETAPAFLLFGLLSGTVTFWFSPLMNLLSRKHEYEADAFAREAMGGAAAMTGALRKLAQKNLTNLTPHPWFSAFFYSHPTLVERERALAEAA